MEATLQRIIIPNNPGTADKPQTSEAEQKTAAAEKIRERWVAGEDPVKLQQAAMEHAGVTWQRHARDQHGRTPSGQPAGEPGGGLPAEGGRSFAAIPIRRILHLQGGVSSRRSRLSEVKDSIVKTLQQQQLQDKMEADWKVGHSGVERRLFWIPRRARRHRRRAGRPGLQASAPAPASCLSQVMR